MAAHPTWDPKGVPGLLAATVTRGAAHVPLVTITLARAPAMDDLHAYRAWYLGMYDHWLAEGTQFAMLFDLCGVALSDMDMAVIARKVLLTLALIPRTLLQVSATSVLVAKPSTPGQRVAYSILKKMLFERKDTAPRFLTFKRERALHFVQVKHGGGALDPKDARVQKAVRRTTATLEAQKDSSDDEEDSSDFETSGSDDDDA